jgi:hypothetical protein
MPELGHEGGDVWFRLDLHVKLKRGVGQRLREVVRRIPFAEQLALLGVGLTPVALFVDYRIGAGLWDKTYRYVPYAENHGLAATYHEVVGATQVLWLGLAVAALTRAGTRRGFRSATVACLTALLGLLVVVTAERDRVDVFAVHALLTTLVPLIGIAAVLLSPDLDVPALRRLVLLFAAAVAVVVLGTGLVDLANGSIRDRFDLYLFGSPTDTGLALAATLPLLLTVSPRRMEAVAFGAALAAVLAGALLLTQTRGALISAAAGGLVVAVFSRRLRPFAIAAVVLGVLGFAAFSDRSLFGLSDYSSTLRRDNLERHWQLFELRPLFGYGMSANANPLVAGAHNTLLGVANAGGAGASALWLVAWAAPILAGIRRSLTSIGGVVPLAVLTAVIVGWFTTGSEVLVFTQPTNLLPLVFAVALARAARPARAEEAT